MLTQFILSSALLVADPSSPTGQADVLVREAFELRQQHRPEEALQRLEKADAIAPSPRIAAQRGLVETSLHRWVAAEQHLLGALATEDPWVAKNRASLSSTLTQVLAHLAHVSVTGRPGTKLSADGRDVGILPMSSMLSLEPGDVALVGTLPGFLPARATLHLEAGQNTSVALQQLPEPKPVAAAPVQTPVVPRTSAPHDESAPSHALAWTGGAVAAAGLVGVALGAYWIHSDGRPSCGDVPSGQVCGTVYDTATQGYVATGLGAAALIGGGFMLWRGLVAHSEDRVALLPNGIAGRF